MAKPITPLMKLSAYSVQLDLIPPDCVLFSFTIQKGTGLYGDPLISMIPRDWFKVSVRSACWQRTCGC